MSISFGDWLLSLRNERQLTLQALSEQTGVPPATLNRLEKSQNDVRLMSAIRICEGLGVSVQSIVQLLYDEFHWSSHQAPEPTPDDAPVLLAADVAAFLEVFYDKPMVGRALLSSQLNKVSDVLYERSGMFSDEIHIDPNSISAFLGASQLYGFTLRYPQSLEAQMLLDSYNQGGILLPQEVQLHMSRLKGIQLRTRGQRDTEQSRPVTGVISRLMTMQRDRMTLADVLAADVELNEQGRLISMFWAACKFLVDIEQRNFQAISGSKSLAFKRREVIVPVDRVVVLLVTLVRWRQYLAPSEMPAWLGRLRTEMALAQIRE